MRVEGYELFLDFDPPARSFRGHVAATLETDEPTIRLNAVELSIASATVDGAAVATESDAEAQELRLPAGRPGRHVARVEFSGRILPDGLTGMYVSPFGGGEILTTQMYPTGARRLFPCVDVPAQKAEFRVSVRVPRGARVIFNTDPESVTEEASARVVRFLPTPRMSSYLIYLGIGPFEESERADGGLRILVAHPAGRTSAAQFALDHAARFVREYESYYDIPYPLPKLHLVGVPSFWAGAMENWGAIAFRETTLLVDEGTDMLSRRWNRQVLCHEIAHQWFGNLVTNAWWNDFWLNEAFATFVAARIVDRVHPGEATWSDLVQVETGRGFAQDALDSAHPIEVEILKPEQIGEIADGITYGKGASILRMIESYLGEPAFRAGVTAYLNAHRYGTATGNDLWSSLDRHSGEPVSRIMRAWITRPGHPIVEVHREGGELLFRQRKFRYDGKSEPSDWPTPLELDLEGARSRTILEAAPHRVRLPVGAKFRVNPERPGFFHVHYDPGLSKEIVGRWGELSELDQWGLLLDRLFFLTSGDGTLEEYLEVVGKASETSTYLPALTAARQLRGFSPFLPSVARLREAHADFYRRQFLRIGSHRAPGEPDTTGVLRGALGLGLLDSLPEITRELAEAFESGEDHVDRDLLDIATVASVRTGGLPAWTKIRERIPSSPSDEIAERLATALPQTLDPSAFSKTLTMLEGPELAASRIWDVLRSALLNPEMRRPLWAWFSQQLPALEKRWQGTPLLSALLPEMLPWVGLGQGDAVREYFARRSFPEAERGVREGLERLALRERLGNRLGARL